MKRRLKLKRIKNMYIFAAGYVLAFAGWLLAGLFCLVWDRAQPETRLEVPTAALVQAEVLEGGALRTTGADAQMMFTGLAAPVRRVLLEADFTEDPGEMELFYTREPGQGFSAGRDLFAVAGPGGTQKPLLTLPGRRAIGAPVALGYLYTLPPGQVLNLRLDLGMAAGNTVAVGAVVLNPRLPAWQYFVPSLRSTALLVVLPALACCFILFIIDLWAWRRRRVAGKRGDHAA